MTARGSAQPDDTIAVHGSPAAGNDTGARVAFAQRADLCGVRGAVGPSPGGVREGPEPLASKSDDDSNSDCLC